MFCLLERDCEMASCRFCSRSSMGLEAGGGGQVDLRYNFLCWMKSSLKSGSDSSAKWNLSLISLTNLDIDVSVVDFCIVRVCKQKFKPKPRRLLTFAGGVSFLHKL